MNFSGRIQIFCPPGLIHPLKCPNSVDMAGQTRVALQSSESFRYVERLRDLTGSRRFAGLEIVILSMYVPLRFVCNTATAHV